MPPKKGEATLLAELLSHVHWVDQNLAVLQARSGEGLRGKLRQLSGGEEQHMYSWLKRHAAAIQASSGVSAALAALDAKVNASAGAARAGQTSPPETAAARASPASQPFGTVDETPAKKPRLAEDGLEASPTPQIGSASVRDGLTPDTADAMARSCRKPSVRAKASPAP